MCQGVAFYSIKSLINWGIVICVYNLTMLEKLMYVWCGNSEEIQSTLLPW